MKKICKNCKYYIEPKYEWMKRDDSGECISYKFIENPDSATLGSNFGCIHFLKR